MTLLEKWESLEQKIKTENLYDSVRALLLMEQQFVDKKRGQVLNGVLLAYMNTFTDDRNTISELLTIRSSVRRNVVSTRENKPQEKVVFTKYAWESNKGCSTCGNKSNMKKMGAKTQANSRAVPESLEDLEGVGDWRNIIAAFGVNTEQMIKVAKEGGVKIGNTKDPAKVAQKIYVHLRNEGMTSDSVNAVPNNNDET